MNQNNLYGPLWHMILQIGILLPLMLSFRPNSQPLAFDDVSFIHLCTILFPLAFVRPMDAHSGTVGAIRE